jgi:hypothetical protein
MGGICRQFESKELLANTAAAGPPALAVTEEP